MSQVDQDYFAGKVAQELASHLYTRCQEWRTGLDQNGMKHKWRRSYQLYFGRHFAKTTSFTLNDSEIVRTGDKGELTAFAINHYRNLIKHTIALTCNQKVAFSPRAINTDFDSIHQCRIGKNILDYYVTEKKIGTYLKTAAEYSQVFGKGFIFLTWNPGMGRPISKAFVRDENDEVVIGPDGEPQEQVLYEGDLEVRVGSPWDVYTDPSADDWNKLSWVDYATLENKFELIAQYPKMREQILAVTTTEYLDQLKRSTLQSVDEINNISVRHFVHKRSKALPNGRLLIYAGQDCVLYDGPSPYDDHLPVFRIVPGELFGSTEGYSDFFDLMGMQEALDVLVSIAFTNQQANGTQKIWAPDGCNLTVTQISKGLAFLRSPAGTKPEPLQLTSTAKEIFDMIPLLEKGMEGVSGINAVARGNLDAIGKNASGVSIAYVQAMAAQYNTVFQQSWAELMENVGSFALWLLRHFADTPRIYAITGKRNQSYAGSFTKHDLTKIERVTVDIANPVTKTVGGRISVADNLLDKGLIKTGQEYLTVLETGNLDPLLEASESEVDLVHKENEALMDGKQVQAVVGDPHLLHMQTHRKVYADPEIRQKAAMGDPQAAKIIQGALSHQQEHMQLYKSQDPLWSQISGEPPAPPPPPPPMPPGPPPGPQGPPGGPPPNAQHVVHHQAPPHHGGPPIAQLLEQNPQVAHIPRLPPGLQPENQGMPHP